VIWDKDHATGLGTLGGTFIVTAEINAKGQAVGTSTLQGDAVFHGFLWRKGVLTDVGVLPGDVNSIAAGINDQGQVVGGSFGLNEASGRPFLWQNGVMTDLSTLIKPGSTSLTVFFANDINSRGEIVAEAFNPSNNEQRTVLLIPCNGEHGDNKGCAAGGGASISAVNTTRPPWPLLPERIRALLQERYRFGGVGVR
jgi:probable HAF family extracellular repeat protein